MLGEGGGSGGLQVTIEGEDEGGEDEERSADTTPAPSSLPLSPLPGPLPLSSTWSGGAQRPNHAFQRGYSLGGADGGFRATAAGGFEEEGPGRERGSFRFDSAQVLLGVLLFFSYRNTTDLSLSTDKESGINDLTTNISCLLLLFFRPVSSKTILVNLFFYSEYFLFVCFAGFGARGGVENQGGIYVGVVTCLVLAAGNL